MIMTKTALPRRAFLRGMGATLALPFLDAMVPAVTALARTAARPVTRLGFVYVPNGIQLINWWPKGEGAAFEVSPILRPLAPFRDQLTVVSGLSNARGDMNEEGGAAHTRRAHSRFPGHALTPTGVMAIRCKQFHRPDL